ncbi:MAG: hypothetical protein V3V14_03945, partial [Saprospiraceae bacterium]
ICFLKSKQAVVSTQAESNLSSLIQQRKRWATKSKDYAHKNILLIQGFVFFISCLVIVNLLMSLVGSLVALYSLGVILIIKLLVDYLYLSKLAAYFKNKKPLNGFLFSSLFFLGYIIFAGLQALFPNSYKWKGRDNGTQ